MSALVALFYGAYIKEKLNLDCSVLISLHHDNAPSQTTLTKFARDSDICPLHLVHADGGTNAKAAPGAIPSLTLPS